MRHFLVLLVLFGFGSTPALSQVNRGLDPAGLQLTRPELQQMLERFEQTASEHAYSASLRQQAAEDAAMIRQRLQEGDLRAGDRVALVVERFPELTDTFNIGAGRAIVLPEIGEISLIGVLRSELQPYLTERLSRFINDPVVHARSLVRLEIIGAVVRPGFYTVPSDVLVGDALMVAGGPLAAAQLDRITIQRGNEEIWSGERMREAIIEGRTLDQLSIRAGDGIHVPQRSSRLETLRNGAFIITGIASLIALAAQVGIF